VMQRDHIRPHLDVACRCTLGATLCCKCLGVAGAPWFNSIRSTCVPLTLESFVRDAPPNWAFHRTHMLDTRLISPIAIFIPLIEKLLCGARTISRMVMQRCNAGADTTCALQCHQPCRRQRGRAREQRCPQIFGRATQTATSSSSGALLSSLRPVVGAEFCPLDGPNRTQASACRAA